MTDKFLLVGNSSTLLITPLLGMGKVLGFIGRASKATDMYHRAIGILENSCGAESEQLVVPLFALGNLLIKEGKVTDAEETFVRLIFFNIVHTFLLKCLSSQ